MNMDSDPDTSSRFQTRRFLKGDEIQINNLYNSVTDIDRRTSEFEWEWLSTWNGTGMMELLFDNQRPEDDQLICLYGLIPVPFHIRGKPQIAGKTENCISHPDIRGTGLYFSHEKQGFEKAKSKYDLFFTTSGYVRAAAAIREKLGFVALDSWVRYVYSTNRSSLRELLPSSIRKWSTAATLFSWLLWTWSRLKKAPELVGDVEVFDEEEFNINTIALLWEKNKNHYGISVDRSSEYLAWRLTNNPHVSHKYLVLSDNSGILGYICFVVNESSNAVKIIDVLADNRSQRIFQSLISALIQFTRENGHTTVVCLTLAKNELLKRAFKNCGFIGLRAFSLKRFLLRQGAPSPFYVFVKEELGAPEETLDPRNWYVTDLVSEGLTG